MIRASNPPFHISLHTLNSCSSALSRETPSSGHKLIPNLIPRQPTRRLSLLQNVLKYGVAGRPAAGRAADWVIGSDRDGETEREGAAESAGVSGIQTGGRSCECYNMRPATAAAGTGLRLTHTHTYRAAGTDTHTHTDTCTPGSGRPQTAAGTSHLAHLQ